MTIRPFVEELYRQHTAEMRRSVEYTRLIEGTEDRDGYDRFLANVIKAHLQSPQFLGFLFGISPPASVGRVRHNLLEEMGIADAQSHPSLLLALAEEAGLAPLLPELEKLAIQSTKKVLSARLLFGTLKEIGFGIMLEVFSFEYMLSHGVAGEIAHALNRHRGLRWEALAWFTHHSELDVRHAEEAFLTLDDYVAHYEISAEDARTIAEMTTRENLFVKRYFGELSLARLRGMVH